jgi:predicted  nucleic acid-binding Zn-ribbon protein
MHPDTEELLKRLIESETEIRVLKSEQRRLAAEIEALRKDLASHQETMDGHI